MVMVLLMMILIMGIFGWIMYAYFESMYSSKLLKINSDVTYQLADGITTQIDSIRDAQESFSVNTTVNRFLSTDSEYEKLTLIPLYESLQQAYKKMRPGLHSIVLKKKDGSIFSDPSGISEINISNTAPAFAKLESGAQSVLIVNGSKAFIAMKQDVYQSGGIRKKVGSCMFVILADSLMSGLKAQDAASRELFVIDSDLRVIAHNGDADVGAELPEAYASYLNGYDGTTQQLTGSAHIVVLESIPALGWTVMCLTPKSTVFSELSVIKYTSYLLLISMLLVVSIVYLMQELSISRAFKRFIAHINAIAGGQQVQPLKLRDSAEFHQMAEAFNRMMRKLEALNAHNLEYHEKILLQDIENKQSQLLALQSQINPHFLYNTLECINSAGAVCGSREVEEMSTALAFIFRYAIKGENIVRLQDELDTLQYYLNIQQIRFPDRFSVCYDIPEGLRERRMLKFLLQPIVENSIQHGFQECTPPCVIRIRVSETDGKLRVVIADNGTGILPETLQALQERLENHELSTDSIGLMNIQRRIRLYYGEAFGLHVESEYGKGTTITALLPAADSPAHEEQQNV
ncbi:MAG: sensor histidine kinase [Clostridia bacterium]|nr:sensor histidine kinase [Clostridia bacterium]